MLAYLKSFWNRRRIESDMREELDFHIRAYARDLEAKGTPHAEAMRQACLTFGSIEAHKEECRASLGLRLWDELSSDLRSGVRVLRQSPIFTAVAIISIALGIGANTSIFTLANEFLLKTLPVPHAERLRRFSWVRNAKAEAHVWGTFEHNERGEGTGSAFPYPLFREMQSHPSVMQDLTGFKDVQRLTATVGDEAEAVDGLLVAGNFYACLGVRMEAGRTITPADDAPSASAVVVISDAFWNRRFGRSASVLGQTIRLNRIPATIIGINPPEFKGPKLAEAPEVFFPLSLQPSVIPRADGSLLTRPDYWWIVVFGRLKPGVNDQAASAALTRDFIRAFDTTIPSKWNSVRPRFLVESGAGGLDIANRRLRKPIYLLLGVAGLVLLIACANVANLLLARATVRQREISLRLALGAGRIRIMRQLLTESLLLAVFGGVAGLLLGFLARNLIPRLLYNAWSISTLDAEMDWRVFLFAFVITLLTGSLFGIVPACHATRTEANAALKETDRMSTGRSKILFGKALVSLQIALSLILVVGAGLFLRSLVNLHHAPTGLETENILLFELDPPRSHYSAPQRIRLYQRVLAALSNVPAVESATASSYPLLAGNVDTDCYYSGDGPQNLSPTDYYVGSNFFATFGIPILNGRGVEERDTSQAPKVAVINQQMARASFGIRNPIGQTIRACGDPKAPLIEVVGVSADAKYSNVRSAASATIYFPYAQADDVDALTFEVKTAAPMGSIIPAIRAIVRAADKDLPLLEVRTQTQQIEATLTLERIFASLTSGFSALALLLAGIGIYGLMAYTVSHRSHEIGIRMVLGAQSRQVLVMILAETSLMTVFGIIAGLAGAVGVGRLIASMLFGVEPVDPTTLAGGASLLFTVALTAAFFPAWRAARVNPRDALRHE